MKPLSVALAVFIAVPALAQNPPSRVRSSAGMAEAAIRQASQQLASQKKSIERNLEVLTHLRAADAALADPMQPAAAIQKAFEHVEKAKALATEHVVVAGAIRLHRELESARRSPGTADFGRLRALLRDEALDPASRVAVQAALRLEEEILAWIKIQELVSAHLRALSEIAGDSLRATQSEK
ncbi:MAG TPA: hypothetical protein VNA69_00170 [Thermoanaerobaculia bacterium]|nr:hypothetical protein [Thermoanaerobaculia bacterium]